MADSTGDTTGTETGDGTGTGSDGAQGPQDAKSRFREALARKRDSAHRSAEGRQNTGVVHGAEVKAGGKRSFRRKTG